MCELTFIGPVRNVLPVGNSTVPPPALLAAAKAARTPAVSSVALSPFAPYLVTSNTAARAAVSPQSIQAGNNGLIAGPSSRRLHVGCVVSSARRREASGVCGGVVAAAGGLYSTIVHVAGGAGCRARDRRWDDRRTPATAPCGSLVHARASRSAGRARRRQARRPDLYL